MVELLGVYLIGILIYPIAIAAYAIQSGLYVLYAVWLVMGFGGWFFLSNMESPIPKFGWAAIWFMPSTLICGAAAVIPWPVALLWSFGDLYGCITELSLVVTLIGNFAILFGVRALIVKVRLRRANA